MQNELLYTYILRIKIMWTQKIMLLLEEWTHIYIYMICHCYVLFVQQIYIYYYLDKKTTKVFLYIFFT